MRLLHQTGSDLTVSRQWYRRIRTYRSGGDVGEPDAVIRTTVIIEGSGDPQSTYLAEVWTPNGWTEIVSIFPGDPALPTLENSYGIRAEIHVPKREASLDTMTDLLLGRALEVLTPRPPRMFPSA